VVDRAVQALNKQTNTLQLPSTLGVRFLLFPLLPFLPPSSSGRHALCRDIRVPSCRQSDAPFSLRRLSLDRWKEGTRPMAEGEETAHVMTERQPANECRVKIWGSTGFSILILYLLYPELGQIFITLVVFRGCPATWKW